MVDGGGIYNRGHFTCNDSIVSGNVALGPFASGGGIYNTGTVELNDCQVTDNQPDQCGGPTPVPNC